MTSSTNYIRNNDIIDNEIGINVKNAEDNWIFHNNIINNTIQACNEGNNTWDDGYPSGGNYWSDYTGFDVYFGPAQDLAGNDGIGDTPYVFDFAQDNYPLMEPGGPSNDILTFDIPVLLGWNFISTPLVQSNTSLLAVLDDNGGDTTFSHAQWYNPIDLPDHWKSFDTSRPMALNDLTDIDHRMGVYVYIDNVGSDSNLTVKGTLPPTIENFEKPPIITDYYR